MITPNSEGLKKASKASYITYFSNWSGAEEAWEDMGGSEPYEERIEWELTIQAAVSAYLEHTEGLDGH